LTTFGCAADNIYSEQTASSDPKPELNLAINALRSGDKLVVERLSALGYNVSILGNILLKIEEKSADLVILDIAGHSMDTSTKIGLRMFKALQAAADLFTQQDREKKMENLAKSRNKMGS
jgi:DNA invertase Pin-like site-specific DNA recombinase